MYKAVRKFHLSDVPPDELLEVVWDVRTYPEYVKGIEGVEVLEEEPSRCLARFHASLAGMPFDYVLELRRHPDAVRWQRVSGSFRDAAGLIQHLGGDEFRYENAMDPGFAVPEFAVRLVLERSLPRLIKEFTGRARAVHRARPAADGG